MSAPPPVRALVAVEAAAPATVAEALRAAVGLTLRGAAVEVILADPDRPLLPDAARARATLALFGHPVRGPAHLDAALASATVIEVWRDPPPAAITLRPGPAAEAGALLHLCRSTVAAPVAGVQVLHLDADDGWPDRVLDHLLAGGAVAVW